MYSYILRRLVFLIFVLLGISVLLFSIMYLLPGDPAKSAAGPGARPEQVEALRIKLGLDKPAYLQYVIYLGNLIHGDLGVSIRSHQPVIKELRIYFPASLELVIAAMFLNLLIGIPLGVFSSLKPGSVVDNSSRLFSAIGMGMPIFWVALMAQLILYGKLHLLPVGGRLSTGATPPQLTTGFFTIDALIEGNLPLFMDASVHLLLPALILALPEIAVTARLMRSSMLNVLGEDYIRTARAKGMVERRVIWKHALKNAFLVPLTLFVMQIGWMLGGALLVESVFSRSGLGFLAYNAIYKRDFPIIMGVTLLMCIVFVLSNLVVDILYKFVDPRIAL